MLILKLVQHLVDLVHHLLVLSDIQIVYLTRVRMEVIEQWRIIVMKCVVVPTDWVWVDVLAKGSDFMCV